MPPGKKSSSEESFFYMVGGFWLALRLIVPDSLAWTPSINFSKGVSYIIVSDT